MIQCNYFLCHTLDARLSLAKKMSDFVKCVCDVEWFRFCRFHICCIVFPAGWSYIELNWYKVYGKTCSKLERNRQTSFYRYFFILECVKMKFHFMCYNIILHICYNDLSFSWKAGIMILLPAGQRDFALIWTVQTSTGVHPGSCSLTTPCSASSRMQLYLLHVLHGA